MTIRLNDEQVASLWDDKVFPRFAPFATLSYSGQEAVMHFANGIAALAVQEVERERDDWRTTAMSARDERDDLREYLNRGDERRHELAGECQMLRAQLAEVTKERDFYRLDAERHAQFADSYRAQLSSDKREALVPCRECAGSGLVPATPSGDYTQAELDCRGCSGPCGQCATPSPEAREVPSEAVILRIIITPADAKRIMAMAKVRP